MDALIGYTGFVGSNLATQHKFDGLYNSSNIHDISGQRFESVVCAAAPGSMLEANKFPERDKEKIDSLIEHLKSIKTDKMILISSIAVLDKFSGMYNETTANFQHDLAYGRNRRWLETFCLEHFKNTKIIRLPALFGCGLKKNFLFDILNPTPSMLSAEKFEILKSVVPTDFVSMLADYYQWQEAVNMYKLDRAAFNKLETKQDIDDAVVSAGFSAVNFTHPDSTFQFYNISKLWSDICFCENNDISVLHVNSAPLKASDIYQRLTGKPMPITPAKLHHEDMRSQYVTLLNGRSSPYMLSEEEIFNELSDFYSCEKQ